MSVGIVLAARPAKSVKLLHAALECRMDVRRRAFVEAGVGDGDDLARPFAARRPRTRGHAQHAARNAVQKFARDDLLDMADFVYGSHVGESPGLQDETDLAARDAQLCRGYMCGLRDAPGRLFCVRRAVKHDIDGLALRIEISRCSHGGRRDRDAIGLRSEPPE